MIKNDLTVWITNPGEVSKGAEPWLSSSCGGGYVDMSSNGWLLVNPKHISLKMGGTKLCVSDDAIEEVKSAGRELMRKKLEAAKRAADEAEAEFEALAGGEAA